MKWSLVLLMLFLSLYATIEVGGEAFTATSGTLSTLDLSSRPDPLPMGKLALVEVPPTEFEGPASQGAAGMWVRVPVYLPDLVVAHTLSARLSGAQLTQSMAIEG